MLPNGIFKDSEFLKKIRRIRDNLGFSYDEDIKARDILLRIIRKQEKLPIY